MAERRNADPEILLRAHFAAEIEEERSHFPGGEWRFRLMREEGRPIERECAPVEAPRSRPFLELRTEASAAALLLLLTSLALLAPSPSEAATRLTRGLEDG